MRDPRIEEEGGVTPEPRRWTIHCCPDGHVSTHGGPCIARSPETYDTYHRPPRPDTKPVEVVEASGGGELEAILGEYKLEVERLRVALATVDRLVTAANREEVYGVAYTPVMEARSVARTALSGGGDAPGEANDDG